MLADVVERVTGDDFRDVLERRVCAPLGLPRLLGIAAAEQGDVVDDVVVGQPGEYDLTELMRHNEPAVREAGVPGGGGILSAATMACFYQALLHDPAGLWDAAVLDDVKTNVRCRFDDPLMHVPANRTLGLVLAGDDGLHQFRYGMFGAANSPRTFGHAGACCQVAWADPETGISFVFTKNGLDADMIADAVRVLPLCDLAAALLDYAARLGVAGGADEVSVELLGELVDHLRDVGVLAQHGLLLGVVVIGLRLLERSLAVLADHHEGREEDRLQRHGHGEEVERELVGAEQTGAAPQGEDHRVDVDEVHRPRERRDRVGDTELDVLRGGARVG